MISGESGFSFQRTHNELLKKKGLICYKYVFFSKSGFENAHIDDVEKINIDAGNCSEVAINTCCLWRKNMIQGANPIAEGDFAWICDRNYEGTE